MDPFPFNISPGKPYPFGASPYLEGFNFSVISTTAKAVTLCLFSPADREKPFYEIKLDTAYNKTGDVWHVALSPLPADLLYLYRVDELPQLLSDPYAKSIASHHQWEDSSLTSYRPFGALISVSPFDWKGDLAPKLPLSDLVIYEMHVRGFTQDVSSRAKAPGTFLGVVEKIPHLLDLGVNALEFLPVYEFNETEYAKLNPATKLPLCNYWGYSTVNFFSPMQRYAFSQAPHAAIDEFKTMVRELHRHGIEVILDVVYNHTAEGNEKGPILSFKGLDNAIYYLLDNRDDYLNFSGCGNTFSCNHPIVRELILDSLRYWVTEMHVDGFRFDLASILGRGVDGRLLSSAPILEAISEDPILANCKLIAEPWDVGGLYQVGSFFPPGRARWSEWNGRYRDVIRRFMRGSGEKGAFAGNLSGSQDFYYKDYPCRSVNFVTAHDGFTLADLVTYDTKHNLSNGENNQDGTNDNESWNCGVEGQTFDKTIASIRARQMRNFHLVLMLSRGIPMLSMGDEYGHSKSGNNNTWCQDNTLSWFLWNQLEENRGFYRFYKGVVNFRKNRVLLHQNKFLTAADIDWHGLHPLQPHWERAGRFIAFTLKDSENGRDLYAAFNTNEAAVQVELPKCRVGYHWYWVVDTAKASPNDWIEEERSVGVDGMSIQMESHSAILLEARPL